MPTYIVESYAVRGVLPDHRERAEMAAEVGEGIRYIRTTFVPGDETVLHLFEATSSDTLCEAVRVAELECDRIVEVIEARAQPHRRGSPQSRASSPPRRR